MKNLGLTSEEALFEIKEVIKKYFNLEEGKDIQLEGTKLHIERMGTITLSGYEMEIFVKDNPDRKMVNEIVNSLTVLCKDAEVINLPKPDKFI